MTVASSRSERSAERSERQQAISQALADLPTGELHLAGLADALSEAGELPAIGDAIEEAAAAGFESPQAAADLLGVLADELAEIQVTDGDYVGPEARDIRQKLGLPDRTEDWANRELAELLRRIDGMNRAVENEGLGDIDAETRELAEAILREATELEQAVSAATALVR
jgi:hypothetical protein